MSRLEEPVVGHLSRSRDTRYEWQAITLLALGWGMVGLDRWIITPLFPAIVADLHLTYQDVGNAVGALAIVWGVFALLMGRLADRIGRKKVIIPALVIFSVTSALTGFVGGAMSLVLIRAFMGAAEGAYAPASTAAASEATEPHRRGLAQGILFAAFPLFGLGFGPIIATQLLTVVPSWRWVFYVAAIPGIIIAVLLWRVLREPVRPLYSAQPIPWSQVLRTRNVVLATLGMICGMSCVFVLGAMMPNYLVDYLHLTQMQMGFLMSALGFGGALGNFAGPALSDHIGRRGAVVVGAITAAAGVVVLMRLGPEIGSLYTTLFLVAVACFSVVAVMAGPVPTEALGAAVASSAIGIVTGAAEIFGGGIAPILSGAVADRFGIQYVPYIGLIGLCLAVPIGLLLKETAPRAMTRMGTA